MLLDTVMSILVSMCISIQIIFNFQLNIKTKYKKPNIKNQIQKTKYSVNEITQICIILLISGKYRLRTLGG